jgi:hypothetical protein
MATTMERSRKVRKILRLEEPIQQNLGERIAFALTRDGNERRRIVAMVRSISDQRSGFLHHGQSIDDVEAMRDFMHMAWMAMGTLLTKIDSFRTVGEFTSALDDVKFGAGPSGTRSRL